MDCPAGPGFEMRYGLTEESCGVNSVTLYRTVFLPGKTFDAEAILGAGGGCGGSYQSGKIFVRGGSDRIISS